MSFYNLVHGVNPAAGLVLGALGLKSSSEVPRFRDAWIEDGRIAIHTRTGGGNRDWYECEERCRDNYPESFGGENDPAGPWNDDLRALPGFIYDEDDDFDCTYATFYFEKPAWLSQMIEAAPALIETKAPADKWIEAFDELASDEDTERMQRVREALSPIFSQLAEAAAASSPA